MTTKLTRPRLARGLAAAVVGALMIFGGLTPAGASSDETACWARGLTIWARSVPCGDTQALDLELTASRYSTTTGEIMWDRVPGAVGYEIVIDGVSLGVQDVLSWYMTGLDENSDYNFYVRAVDQDENPLDIAGAVTLDTYLPMSSASSNSYWY